VSVFPVFGLFVQEVQQRVAQGDAFRAPRLAAVGAFALWVTLAVFAGEFVMGRAFQLASGEAGTVGPGALGILGAAATCTASDWFLFPMAAEMALTVVFLRARLPGPLVVALGIQAASMFASPTALGSPVWVLGSSLAAAALMLALFGYVMAILYREGRLSSPVLRYLTELVLVYVGMAGGLVLWAATGETGLFAVAVIAQMVVFFTTVLVPETFSPPPPDDLRHQDLPIGAAV
jgi:hypothetical protein